MSLIHELLDLPPAVRKGDYVQDLTGGIKNPDKTVGDYAITAKIVQSYQHALSIIGSALRDGRSQAAYLHGSFGAGKSHFMAVLDLMLADHPAPWRRGELHALRTEFDWVGKKKLLQLPIHMLGAHDMESKILGAYVQWVSERHPDVPLPALYADDSLFNDAKNLRATMGDASFFQKLNGGAQQAATGWGQLVQVRRWDAPSFDAAVNSIYVGDTDRDSSTPRAKLFSDLVRSFFSSFQQQHGRFIDLDAGLGVMSRHAKSLGYDAIVLYLDELILWLAGNSGDPAFVGREAGKLVKLKEAQDADRAIPIVSFIARQRDLAQFLGDSATGSMRDITSRNLSHHEGRFEKVTLADSNLPAIVAHRVVRPKDEAARQMLADDFAKTWRAAGQAQSVLMGSEGDEGDFKKVYPFSPALVEALVALSECLQRERTAIRILVELLVDHLPDLETGRVVPVGDAFDALAGNPDPIDDPVMKARFDRAVDLYEKSFLPLIRQQHATDSSENCQRLRDSHRRELGCSRCPVKACRNDNRLAKTLLMAALVPQAKPFAKLTVNRLVHLNHGTIASPIPGAEARAAAAKLREWATQVGALRIGEQPDPEVSIHLAGIDLKPILAQAAEVDTSGARKVALRKLLFDSLGLPPEGAVVDDDFEYYGTRRKGRVRYGNVREMEDSALACPDGYEWQLILDYPFDEPGHGPSEDYHRLQQHLETRPPGARPNATVVWLPTFFSHLKEKELGELVVLDHILLDTSRFLGHLRVEDQTTTRADLMSLRAQKEASVKRALSAAYGLTISSDSGALDPARAATEHFVALLADLDLRMGLAGNMKDGKAQLVNALLFKRYPHHPRFDERITVARLERVHGLMQRILDDRERKIGVEKNEKNELRGVADKLQLSDTTETVAHVNERPFQDLEQKRQQEGIDTPSVAKLRVWLDPQGMRGLTREVEDLIILLYASWSGRTLQRGGRNFPAPRLGQLPDDAELLRPELPSDKEWLEALRRAGMLFGVAIGAKALSAHNLATFSDQVKQRVKSATEARELERLIEARVRDWADVSNCPRLITARAAAGLVAAICASDGTALVKTLVAAAIPTSLEAMARSITSAATVKALLSDDARWILFQQVRALQNEPTKKHRAAQLVSDLRELLSADELNRMLSQGLNELTRGAGELLSSAAEPPPPPPPGEKMVLTRRQELRGARAVSDGLRDLARELEEESSDGELRVLLEVTAWKKGGAA